MLCTLIGAIILSINIQVGLNMHLYDDIGDASSSLRGSTSSFFLSVHLSMKFSPFNTEPGRYVKSCCYSAMEIIKLYCNHRCNKVVRGCVNSMPMKEHFCLLIFRAVDVSSYILR